MTRFRYRAEKSGEVYKASVEAADRFALYELVRHEGGRILSVSEEKARGPWNLRYWDMKLSRVAERDKILMARNLGAMLSAGLPLSRALSVLERQSANPKLQEVLSGISGDVHRGSSLHDALGKFPRVFPALFVAMVRAGEESGDVSTALSVSADQMERMYDLKKKIRSALIYPAIILLAIFGIGALMMIKVVPTLAQTFAEANVELPPSTRVVMAVSDFLVHYTLFAFLVLLLAIVGGYLLFRTSAARRVLDFSILHVPVVGGIAREVNAAMTARTLASLFSAGVDVISSLSITRDVVQNSYFRAVLDEAASRVARGEPLSRAFVEREDLYPAFVGEMMGVGEETGDTKEMLKRLAFFYEEEVDRKTKDLSTVIEPLLMLLIGGAVGFFAVAMIEPIYSLSQSI